MLNSTNRLELVARLRTAVEDYMTVFNHSFDDANNANVLAENGNAEQRPNGTIRLHGKLKVAPEKAYRPIRQRLERLGYTPYLNDEPPHTDNASEYSRECTHELVAVPGVIPKTPQNIYINIALFVATVISVALAGSSFSDNATPMSGLLSGLMYAGSLLSILVAHEAGHYIVGRLRGAPVSLPYFIPFPLNFFGTMGAVIVQREPFEDRRTMLEIGIAGPLAGFIVAVPLYMFGLTVSAVKAIPAAGSFISFGDSLLTHFFKLLQFGWFQPGTDIFEHPICLGAWIGLLITGINLIPAGQLDGGHIASAILGPKAKYLSYAMIAVMLGLSLVSTSWLLWAALLLVFGRSHPPALNNAARLDIWHYGLGLIALLVFILVFVPRPIY